MPAALPPPSKTRLLTCAPVMTVSSGLSTIGSMNEVQVGHPAAVPDRHVGEADAQDGVGVGVVVARHAALDRRLDHGDRDRVGLPILVTGSGPPTPWYSPGPSSKSSDRLKYGRTSCVGPAQRAVVGPVVEVGLGAADVDHAVERARPAQHLARAARTRWSSASAAAARSCRPSPRPSSTAPRSGWAGGWPGCSPGRPPRPARPSGPRRPAGGRSRSRPTPRPR